MSQLYEGSILDKIMPSIPTEKSISKVQLSLALMCFLLSLSTVIFASNQQVKAVWYRYYDQHGTANLSSSVTPSHIRYGYEALDSNMQVIKKNQAYNVEQDLKQSHSRASQSIQKEKDARLKKAYTHSSVAINKKNEQLKNIKKQIDLQQNQLDQMQADRILFKRQEMELHRKGKPIPNELKDRLKYNAANINDSKNTVKSLQSSYQNTQKFYESIIRRLKTLE